MLLVTQKRLQYMFRLTRITNVSEKSSTFNGDAFFCPCFFTIFFAAIKKAGHGRRN